MPPPGPFDGAIRVPRRTPRIPESRVDHARVRRIDHDFDRADVLILVEHFLPALAAVRRAEHAALGVRRVQMPDRRDEHDVRILRIDGDLADVLRVVEADVRPRLSGVGGLVHAVAVAHRVAQRRFAAADVHRVRRGRRDRDRADRRHGLRVEHRRPHAPRVDRLPHAAVHRAEIEFVRPPRARRSPHPRDRRGTGRAFASAGRR